MNVSITYQPVKYGPRRGEMAVHLEVHTGEMGETLPVSEVTDKITEGFKSNPSKLPSLNVHLEPGLSKEDAIDATYVLAMFQKMGVFVSTLSDGQDEYHAMLYSNYNVVILDQPKWRNFPVHAILTIILQDPEIAMNNAHAVRYIVQTEDMRLKDIAQFLEESKFSWFIHGGGYKRIIV
jgi:hypothetical protein